MIAALQLTIIMSRPAVEQMQNMQKEAVISSLKKDLYQLRDRQHEFIPLENEVANVESKYDMLQDQKQRIENEHKIKLEINRKNILELRQESDAVRMETHKTQVQIQEVLRDISSLKRTCQNKESQIAALMGNNQDMNAKNGQLYEENKSQGLKIRNLKEQRNILDSQSERLAKNLEDNIQLLKSLQKDARTLEAGHSKLQSILSLAQTDNTQLLEQIKNRDEIVNTTYRKLDSLNAEIQSLHEKTKKLEKDVMKSQDDYMMVSKGLQQVVNDNKEQARKIKICENQLRLIENDLDAAILERDVLYNQHQNVSTQNKVLNDEIDQILMEIMEAERKNAEMEKQLHTYITIDEEARAMLNRKENTHGILNSVHKNLSQTGNTIAHLR